MPTKSLPLISVFIAALCWAGCASAQAVHTVGPGVGCNFSNLQTAISAAVDGDQIRLTTGTYTGHFFIHLKGLTLTGGYPDCASDTPTGRSILDQEGSGLVLDVFYPAAVGALFRVVSLNNLTIRRGGGVGPLSGGMIVEGRPGRLQVRMDNVQITDNQRNGTGDHGAGLRIIVTGERDGIFSLVSITGGSIIAANQTAGNGGGIYCESAFDVGVQTLLSINANTLIFDNQAQRGGGLASNGCRNVLLQSGGPVVLFLPTAGVIGNRAERGGGLYVENGGLVRLFGTTGHAALLVGNQASLLGGGAEVTGQDSWLFIEDAYISGNSAVNTGGGISAALGAALRIRNRPGRDGPCLDPVIGGGVLSRPPCNVIENNQAGAGGAFDLRQSQSVVISQAIIRGNQADGGGSVLRIDNPSGYAGPNVEAFLEGVLVNGNQGPTLFSASNNAALHVGYSTVTDNDATLFRISAGAGQVAEVTVSTSIIEASQWRIGIGGGDGLTALTMDCVIGNKAPGDTGADLLLAYSNIDPRFVDRDAANYRLQPTSPAIDYCDGSNPPEHDDLDNNPRGIAWNGPTPEPAPGGGLGLFDLGAYEIPFAALSDDLFADGFESAALPD